MERNNYHTRAGIECLNCCIYNYLSNENQAVSKSDIFFPAAVMKSATPGETAIRLSLVRIVPICSLSVHI